MFHKVRFTSKAHGPTAGIVLEGDKIGSIAEVSLFFPYHEARKMERYEVSPGFAEWRDAFNFDFPAVK